MTPKVWTGLAYFLEIFVEFESICVYDWVVLLVCCPVRIRVVARGRWMDLDLLWKSCLECTLYSLIFIVKTCIHT